VPSSTLTNTHTLDQSWKLTSVESPKEIEALVDALLVSCGLDEGRGKAISVKTAQKVWADAGGRCMFEGCGDDLTEIPLYSKLTRVGYLAHIVASDPRGPRGSEELSHKLANEPSNIMLMCDKHHRLIDCHARDQFLEERLRAMRQRHHDMVRRCLESLKYPRVRAVTLLGNLANTPTHFPENVFLEAILDSGKAMAGTIEYLRRTNLRDERNSPGFWANYLREHENQIRQLVTDFNNGAALTEELAVFPLHHIPMMVLAGRIMGEACIADVFQYHRERRNWAWDKSASPKPPDTFTIDGLITDHAEEVFVSFELTASLDVSALPSEIAPGRVPWVRITTSQPSFDCIAHPQDLEQFTRAARTVINHVQDRMRASWVHFIAISPASTVFRFGQMLQAGHHPKYVLYDRADRNTPFAPAMVISGQEVSTADDQNHSIRISIR